MNPVVLPVGFVERYLRKQTWWVKAGWEPALTDILDRIPFAPRLPGGRGMIYRITQAADDTLLVRPYQRGGLIRYVVHDLYWDRPFRPFAELAYTEVARQRGVPTVEVIAAGVEHAMPPFYRGMLITRAAQGFVNLWDWLQTKPSPSEREQMMAKVASTIACLHNAGIVHTDLNLTNILVRMQAGAADALLIDFDRARVFAGPVAQRWRLDTLRRMRRSLAKLDPARLLCSAADMETFCRAYHVR